ncbi:hypothetical protein ACIPSA_50725 [Streptomyces sp. NPDC086549]|uniref:effector-associated constant component EACC1 n=1 Tax=Streptomyces sp. NPDC086549 TaxID=3365752 RepID=UPI003817B75A
MAFATSTTCARSPPTTLHLGKADQVQEDAGQFRRSSATADALVRLAGDWAAGVDLWWWRIGLSLSRWAALARGGARVRFEVRVEPFVGELRSLQDWLRSDPEVRRSTAVEVRGSRPGPGEMGSALDVLEFVTGNGWSAASFVLAVASWRQTRSQRPRVEIRRGDTVIVLTDCSQEEIERATGALDALEGEGEAGR